MRRYVSLHGIPLVSLGLSMYFVVSIVFDVGQSLTAEDNLFENLTVAFYLTGALFCTAGLLVPRQRGRSIARYWLLGWALLFLLVAMEEISWGQRMFGIETPGFIASHNGQDEVNLHNFASELVNRSFYSMVFLVGVVLPSAMLLSRTLGNVILRWGVPLPQDDMIVPFALALAFVAPALLASTPEMVLFLAATFLWLSFALTRKLIGRPYGFSPLHLVIGVGGLALVQMALLFFEGNLVHENQPSEIKEFLFSVCFLIFAYRIVPVFGLLSGRRVRLGRPVVAPSTPPLLGSEGSGLPIRQRYSSDESSLAG